MRACRRVADENWIQSSVDFNRWLKENADETNPSITLLDNTRLTPEEGAAIADRWIRERIENFGGDYIERTI